MNQAAQDELQRQLPSIGVRVLKNGCDLELDVDKVLGKDELGALQRVLAGVEVSSIFLKVSVHQPAMYAAFGEGLGMNRGCKLEQFTFWLTLGKSKVLTGKEKESALNKLRLAKSDVDNIFGSLPNTITNLWVRDCLFVPGCEACLASSLVKHTNLEFVKMSRCRLGSKGANALAGLVQRNPNLLVLDLVKTGISSQATDLFRAICCHPHLKKVHLDGNPRIPEQELHGLFLEALSNRNCVIESIWIEQDLETNFNDEDSFPVSFDINQGKRRLVSAVEVAVANGEWDLRVFDLPWRNLFGNEIGAIVACLLKAKVMIKELDLEGNFLGRRWAAEQDGKCGAQHVATLIEKSRSLEKLKLQSTHLSSEVCDIAKALGKSSSLKYLNLCDNKIDDETAQALADALAQNKSLETLELEDCGLSDAGKEVLANAVCSSKQITSVKWDGELPSAVAAHLARNKESQQESQAIVDYESSPRASFGQKLAQFVRSSLPRGIKSAATTTTCTYKPSFQFKGKPQRNNFDGKLYGPEFCGITLAQLEMMVAKFELNFRSGLYGKATTGKPTAYQFVEHYVLPLTAGTGMSLSLIVNRSKPLKVKTMVTHAWAEGIGDMVKALQHYENQGGSGPYWICFAANFQNNDESGPLVSEQLTDDPLGGPFAAAIRCCKSVEDGKMVAVVTGAIDIYERMWCIFEQYISMTLDLPVDATQHQGNDGVLIGNDLGSDLLVNPLQAFAEKRVQCVNARCGKEDDEQMIRAYVEQLEGGFEIIDSTVEKIRLGALLATPFFKGRKFLSPRDYAQLVEEKVATVRLVLERMDRKTLSTETRSMLDELNQLELRLDEARKRERERERCDR